MAHLFKKTEYIDFRGKYYVQIKKSLQQRIQYVSQNLGDNLHPIEGLEETVIDQSQFNMVYDGETIVLPKRLLEVEDFSTFLNMETIQKHFSQQQISQILELTPNKKLEEVQYALTGKGFYQKHLTDFERKTKSGYFSVFREKEDQIIEKLSKCKLKQIYQDLYAKILRNRNSKNDKNIHFSIKDDISEVASLQDLEELNQFSDNSYATQTQEEIEEKPEEQITKQIFFKYDYSKLKTQEEMFALGEQKREKVGNVTYKMTLPSRPRNMEWVENYRKQEILRYLNPTKPWTYTCEDGRKVTVAPVAKKMSVLTGKPRDHPLLKTERPACVTILTLVRDAASRLPNGVGTRADICELLKQSQYINESLPEDKVSNIVSGALDRLHYMSDACVKYDSEKKLWIYLHLDRSSQHPGWGDDGEQYTEKNKKKKKGE